MGGVWGFTVRGEPYVFFNTLERILIMVLEFCIEEILCFREIGTALK